MNCQGFEKLVLTLARDQSLDAAVREQGLAHTEVCVRCAARLAEERAFLTGMRAVVGELAEQEAPARVEAALLTAFRLQVTVAAPVVTPIPVRTRRWTSWQRGAVAAGILILISVPAIFWQRSGSRNQQRETRAGSPTPYITSGPQTPLPLPSPLDRGREMAQDPVAPRPRHQVRHQSSGNNSDEAEVVTEFFPLREGEDLSALESGRLIRVELPGSALSEVGLPVDPETVNTPVKADVVLGDDGLARAIRFVR
jgi:hypothetical protein